MTTDPLLEAWLKGPVHLLPQVEKWFREATREYQPPNKEGCWLFAQHLHAIGPPGYSSMPADRKFKEADVRILVKKTGEDFLKYLARQRESTETLLRLQKFQRVNQEEIKETEDILFRMDEVHRHLKVLLPYISPELDERPEPIRFLGQLAQQLWAEANYGRAPRSLKANHAICTLLEKSIEALGHKHPRRAGISDILRERRRIR